MYESPDDATRVPAAIHNDTAFVATHVEEGVGSVTSPSSNSLECYRYLQDGEFELAGGIYCVDKSGDYSAAAWFTNQDSYDDCANKCLSYNGTV
jgi:hypothetical protein